MSIMSARSTLPTGKVPALAPPTATPPGNGSAPEGAASSSGKKPRADAAANHQRLLDAAREVFAEVGTEATMDQVARRAGLGVGTAYRHFPNKRVLLAGLFDDRLAAFVEAARADLADPDPWHGLAAAMTRLAEDLVEIRALHDVVLGPEDAAPTPPEALGETMTALLVRAQEAGVVRADLTTDDLMTLQSMVDAAADRDPEGWPRFLEILLDGIRRR